MEQIKRELTRKLLHLPVFLFPLTALYSKAIAIAALIILAFIYIAAILFDRRWGKKVPIFSPIIDYCKRNTHYDFGPLYLALSMAAVIYIADPIQPFFAAYVMAISDSLASLVGMRFGGPKIALFNKSYLGSFTFFATCFLGGLYFLSPIGSLIAAAALTLIELVSLKGLDNLTLPLAAQLAFIFLR